jgi:hypothetical protein
MGELAAQVDNFGYVLDDFCSFDFFNRHRIFLYILSGSCAYLFSISLFPMHRALSEAIHQVCSLSRMPAEEYPF